MATCFCAYVRKMKELDILPMLRMDAQEVEKENIETISTLIRAISPIQYSKEENVRKEWEAITGAPREEDLEEWRPPEEKEIFHLPFFFK